MINDKIALIDLKRQYRNIKSEIDSAIISVIERGDYILGPEVTNFENDFAAYNGSRYAVGVASGTDALLLSLQAVGVGTGDEVITVGNTFISTVDAIARLGARPVLVDVEKDSYCASIQQIRSKVTSKTKAIIPVHLYGHPADIDEIMETAQSNSLHVIEDACQAHGALYKGKRAGSLGHAGCFSFYPSKNLGGYGDGGAILTSNQAIFESLRMLRNYGQKKKYYHDLIGYNSRLDEVQAAILRVKLRHLDRWNEQRRSHAKMYNDLLRDLVTTPAERSYVKHIYYTYNIMCKDRDSLRSFLDVNGVSTGIYYPVPIHLQKAYSHLGVPKGSLPVTELTSEKSVALPMFAELTEPEIHKICNLVRRHLKN